jgi:hypothetical protein
MSNNLAMSEDECNRRFGMKKTLLAVLMISGIFVTSSYAGTMFSAVDDFSNTTNTEKTVWSYRFANDQLRDDSYALLTTNSDPLPVWNPPTPFWHTGTGDVPGVGVNRSGAPIPINGSPVFSWPDETVWMHPGNSGLAVVSRSSPTSTAVDVQFSFSDMDPNGGNGVLWFVDLGDSSGNLASGTLSGGGSGLQKLTIISMTAGDRLNFVIDSNGNEFFDSTEFTATVVPSVLECDFMGDGVCDITDLNEMLSIGPVSDGVPAAGMEEYDLTGDGVINNEDVDEWLALAAEEDGFGSPYKRADANLDGTVDGLDFILWNAGKFTATLLWDGGDFNGDGINDGLDFIQWNANKFTSSDGVSAVPEPGIGRLLMAALISLAVARRP